jgi:hypothetical protein
MTYLRPTLVLAAALVLCADTSDLAHFRMPMLSTPAFGSMPGAPFPNSALSNSSGPAEVFMSVGPQAKPKAPELQEPSRLAIIRFVDGEFAKVVEPLPGGKKGFKFDAGKPLDVKSLHDMLRSQGAAANQGDTVQITRIEFRAKDIVFQINGGGKRKFHLRDHLQVGVGGTANQPLPAADPNEGKGATLILDFGRTLPDLSPDDLKQDLSVLLDFSKEHSAAVDWIDTLPPKFKEAIQNHEALEGMDQEMVIAALGRADHKVRQRDAGTGEETEDWIYGNPPAKTVFVTFSGDKVIRVKSFN